MKLNSVTTAISASHSSSTLSASFEISTPVFTPRPAKSPTSSLSPSVRLISPARRWTESPHNSNYSPIKSSSSVPSATDICLEHGLTYNVNFLHWGRTPTYSSSQALPIQSLCFINYNKRKPLSPPSAIPTTIISALLTSVISTRYSPTCQNDGHDRQHEQQGSRRQPCLSLRVLHHVPHAPLPPLPSAMNQAGRIPASLHE